MPIAKPNPTLLGRITDALASLRLAITVMVALGLACIVATFYESKHGTPAAQREFYGTWWFALLLTVLAASVLVSMLKRFPWNRHHTGFVLAHVGILLILGGSLVSLQWGLDSSMALYEGESADRVTLQGQALHASLPGAAEATVAVDFVANPPLPGRAQRFALPGSEAALVAEEYSPHVRVSEGLEESTEGGPALHFRLAGPNGVADDWLVADAPDHHRAAFGPLSVDLQAAASPADVEQLLAASAAQRANQVSFVLTPEGALRYRVATANGDGASGIASVGSPIVTPWMGMTVTVDRLLRHAVARRNVEPLALPEKGDRQVPAVRVRLELGSWKSATEWVLYGETWKMPSPRGPLSVAFAPPSLAVPFRVTLLRFNSDKYPGSRMASSYESWVRVDDPERGASEHHIAMNDPLHYRGYIFFQSSFVEGTPMMSIFSVTRAPGLPVVYLGTGFLCVGVLWMFYLKPYLAKRQAARALAARRPRATAEPVHA